MDGQPEEHTLLRVDDLVIDPGTRLVHRGEEDIELPRLSFHLLLELAQAAPNVMTYDELIDRVWSGRIVSQETVTQRVKLLRQALGDDAQAPRYIGLARGEGYRLLPPVTPAEVQGVAVTAGTSGASRGLKLGAGLLLIVVAASLWFSSSRNTRAPAGLPEDPVRAPHSVAVLPFVNASESDDDLYLSEGLGNELREQLARQLGLRVSARTSSRAFRDQSLDATEISARLGVANLIEGTLRREADQLRISIQIIDGSSGFQTWTRTYNLHVQNLLATQQQIAQEVIQQLLPMADTQAIEAVPVTRSVTANELMLLASHYERQVRDKAIVDQALLLKAIELYREATEADPGSALAHSRLGAALLYIGDIAAAEAPIFEALQLDPRLADVQYTLGLYHWSRREPGAGAAFERAIALNENLVDALSAYAIWLSLQFEYLEEAAQYFRKALSLDPMSHVRYLELGNHLGMFGWTEEAKMLADEIERRFGPEDGQAGQIIARIHELVGELDVALEWAMRSRLARPGDPEADWLVAEIFARLGMFDQAAVFEPDPGIGQLYWQRRWDELIELAEVRILEYPDESEIWYALAWAYNATGRYEQTIRLLERAGLPDYALEESRRSIDVEAMMTLADAYDATGNSAEARNLAQWYVEQLSRTPPEIRADEWWTNIYLGCAFAILRRDDEALAALDHVARVEGLVWYPLVADAHCFQRFAEEEGYRRVLGVLDRRIADLRRAVPGKLAAIGVNLDDLARSE